MRKSTLKDTYSLFEKLAACGVSVAPFTTSLAGIATVGIPAKLVTRTTLSPYSATIARYGDIMPAIVRAVRSAKPFFLQRHVTGHELACGVVMDSRKIVPLVPVEIIPRISHETHALHMSSSVLDAVATEACRAHKALRIKGHSCVRMVVEKGVPYVVGVEASPALVRTSCFMRSALLAGLTEEEIKEYTL